MTDSDAPLLVLIVDDEDMIRSLLRLTLVRAGYDVTEAETGKEGISIVREQKPDLVLLDVMMPGMDGYAVCEQIRQDPAVGDTPVIMLSARKDPRSRQAGRQAGATYYLTKPWVTDDLLWHVNEALNPTERHSNLGTS